MPEIAIKAAASQWGLVQYTAEDGRVFSVDHRGWIFDVDSNPVPHPLVDDVMRAIIAWERR